MIETLKKIMYVQSFLFTDILHIGWIPIAVCHWIFIPQGLYSLNGKTSYRKISWSLEGARFGFKLFQSLWNLAGTSAALLPRCLSHFRAIRPLQHPISRLRDFTRFGGKTSYRLVNRGPDELINMPPLVTNQLNMTLFNLFVRYSIHKLITADVDNLAPIVSLQWPLMDKCYWYSSMSTSAYIRCIVLGFVLAVMESIYVLSINATCHSKGILLC